MTIDWNQTHWIARHDWQYKGHAYQEINPLLGLYPSEDRVNALFLFGTVAHTFIALALPPEMKWNGEDVTIFKIKVNPRRIWQCIFIGGETGVIGNNFIVGIKIGN